MKDIKNKLYETIKRDRLEWFAIFFLVQTTMLAMMVLYWVGGRWDFLDQRYIFFNTNNVLFLAVIFSGILGLISMYILREVIDLMEKEKELAIQTHKVKQMEEANGLLHAQRHDFLNSMQVLAGMLHLGKIDRAQEYLMEFSNGLKLDNKGIQTIGKVGSSHLNALLLNKMHKCSELNINISYEVEDVVQVNKFSPIDLVRIFGNLLDNAIDAVGDLKKEFRMIWVDLYEDEGVLVFEVHNPMPVIPEDLHERVFDRGFSTKDKEGRGLGLYNVKNLVMKYEGKIELISKDDFGTKFIVRLP